MTEIAEKPKRTRGRQKFGGLTYPEIAELTGLTVKTVEHYGNNSVFDNSSFVAIATWINGQRAKKGLSLIGIPDDTRQAESGSEADGRRSSAEAGVPA